MHECREKKKKIEEGELENALRGGQEMEKTPIQRGAEEKRCANIRTPDG